MSTQHPATGARNELCAAHTPGPWYIAPNWKRGDQGFRHAIAKDSEGHGWFISFVANAAEAEANARLIAAAPELLAMLKRCYGMFQQSPLNKDDNWLSSQLARDLRKTITKAQAQT